jgi:hypothetical protein
MFSINCSDLLSSILVDHNFTINLTFTRQYRMAKISALFAITLASLHYVAAQSPEQLFLDLDPVEALNGTCGTRTTESWATLYHDAIADGRFGDAIYARYNIDGRSSNGTFYGTNHSVKQEILIDAASYHSSYPEMFAEALLFYSNNSNEDTRSDIIEALRQTPTTNLERRDKTYGIKCSGSNLAPEDECYDLLNYLAASSTRYYGANRNVEYWGDCHLRLGPLHGSETDSSQKTINNIGHLIYDECRRSKRCCNGLYVSGYSPQNGGHRKICLSSKSTGCS